MRAYNVQVNVGDLDHALLGVAPRDRGAWLSGFQKGLHGLPCPAGSEALAQGHAFGLACHDRTKSYISRASEGGKKSAAQREAKYGTARPYVEPPSRLASEANPEETINLKPITNNHNINTGQVAIAPTRLIKPSVEEVKAYCSEHGYTIDPEAFVDYYESNGWKVGKNPMKSWKAAIRTWVKRDEGKPKPALVCPHPPGSYAAMDWWALNGEYK